MPKWTHGHEGRMMVWAWHRKLEAEAKESRRRYLPSAMAGVRKPDKNMSCEEFKQFREDSIRKLEAAARHYDQPPYPHGLALSLNGRQLATGSDDTTVRRRDVANGQPNAALGGHTDWVRAVAFPARKVA